MVKRISLTRGYVRRIDLQKQAAALSLRGDRERPFMNPGKIPLVLITGFLGSGKTTLLQRIIAHHRHRRLVYLVNEFGAVDIDGRLLELPPEQLVSIPGGSIFCKCLTGEFIRVLAGITHATTVRPEGVIIEASGIADPNVIRLMLAETRLDAEYDLRHIVTVIDPGSFTKLMHTLPNIIAQVEAADLAIINKLDLYEAEQLKETERELRQLNPTAHVIRTRYAQVDIDITGMTKHGDERRASSAGQYAACADPNYITQAVPLSQPIGMDALADAFRALPPEVYRVKGFVPTPEGTVYVDVSAGGLTCTPVSISTARHELVFIAAPQMRADVEALLRRLHPAADLRIL